MGARRGKDYEDSERGQSRVFPAGMTGTEYMKSLPTEQQIQVLGVTRVNLLRAHEVEWDDLFNRAGELKLLDELNVKADILRGMRP